MDVVKKMNFHIPATRIHSWKLIEQFGNSTKREIFSCHNLFIPEVIWVCGDVAEVGMTVDNPLPAEIKVKKMV